MPKPKAETFAIVVNSSLDGFFKSLQTLVHCTANDFNFSNAITIR